MDRDAEEISTPAMSPRPLAWSPAEAELHPQPGPLRVPGRFSEGAISKHMDFKAIMKALGRKK